MSLYPPTPYKRLAEKTHDEHRQAYYKDGTKYNGHTQYLGLGAMKSCMRCSPLGAPHKPVSGFRKRLPWGMICGECVTEVDAKKAAKEKKA